MTDLYKGKYLYIYADIFFTKGYTKTLMCDLQEKVWHFIPNQYFDTIPLFRKYPINKVIEKNPYNIDVDAFIDYLLKHHYANIVDDISVFPEIKVRWHSSHFIENAIIDIDINSQHNYKKIACELETLLCKHIQIRSYIVLNIQTIGDIIKEFVGKDFSSIEFIVKYTKAITPQEYLLLAKENPSVSFIVHSAPKNKFYESLLHDIYPIVGYVQYIKQIILSSDCCGIINKDTLIHPNNIKDYMEGILRNKCLNQKISIAANGDIKNCPSMKQSYGNIKNTSLIDVYSMKRFRRYWYIKKDNILTCRDCEFRYVCNDCRAFVKHRYDKPLKCHYDPYH